MATETLSSISSEPAEEEEEEIIAVAPADEMTSVNFALHMTHRHRESLGGLSELDLSNLSTSEAMYLEGMYRSFHDRIHHFRIPGYPRHKHRGEL